MHWKRKYGKRTKYLRTCDTCGGEFKSDRPIGRFCSDDCKGIAYSIEKRRTSRDLVPVTEGAYCLLPATHPVTRYAATQAKGVRNRWWTRFVCGPCSWCGTPFTGGTTNSATHCSSRCTANAARARRGRFAIQPQRRLAIYERDNWTCQLCLEPVDPTLDPTDAWAATLDHIECQSWSLVPDHSESNLRLAHRWCNSVRADESWHRPEVLLRSA